MAIDKKLSSLINRHCTHPVASGCTSYMTKIESQLFSCRYFRERSGEDNPAISDVESIIFLIRNCLGRYPDYSGGCYKFYLILRSIFVGAIGYYNGDHVVTKIGDFYYDIDGLVDDVSGYLSFDDYGGDIELRNIFLR